MPSDAVTPRPALTTARPGEEGPHPVSPCMHLLGVGRWGALARRGGRGLRWMRAVSLSALMMASLRATKVLGGAPKDVSGFCCYFVPSAKWSPDTLFSRVLCRYFSLALSRLPMGFMIKNKKGKGPKRRSRSRAGTSTKPRP